MISENKTGHSLGGVFLTATELPPPDLLMGRASIILPFAILVLYILANKNGGGSQKDEISNPHGQTVPQESRRGGGGLTLSKDKQERISCLFSWFQTYFLSLDVFVYFFSKTSLSL